MIFFLFGVFVRIASVRHLRVMTLSVDTVFVKFAEGVCMVVNNVDVEFAVFLPLCH